MTSGWPIFEGGGFDQRETKRFFGARGDDLPLSARPDVLVFETEPLAEDTAVIGPIELTLYVSTDAPDTDFTAKLVDVYPPSADYPQGFALNITDGILRCRYRESFEHPRPMVPGEVCEIRIECFATANLFKAGHRIRLTLQFADPRSTPKLEPAPEVSVLHGRDAASLVELPVIPRLAPSP